MEGKSLPHSLSTEHYQIFLLQVGRAALEEWEASVQSEAIQVSLGAPGREQRAVAAKLHPMAVLTLPAQEEIRVLGATPDPTVLLVLMAQLPLSHEEQLQQEAVVRQLIRASIPSTLASCRTLA